MCRQQQLQQTASGRPASPSLSSCQQQQNRCHRVPAAFHQTGPRDVRCSNNRSNTDLLSLYMQTHADTYTHRDFTTERLNHYRSSSYCRQADGNHTSLHTTYTPHLKISSSLSTLSTLVSLSLSLCVNSSLSLASRLSLVIKGEHSLQQHS